MRALIIGGVSVPIFLSGCSSNDDNQVTTTTTATTNPAGGLEQALQEVLDKYAAAHPTSALQLGFKNEDLQFGLAAGQYWKPGTSGYQNVTLKDTFLFGSGTKPFTATAVMGLVESGKISLDDKLESHIDQVLDKMKPNTTMNSLFGVNGSLVTVEHVLRMTSGINDFDWPSFDQSLLLPPNDTKTHAPLETLEVVASLKPGDCPDHYVCEPFVCAPGECVLYSSTNYILAGLVLAAHSDSKEWSSLDMWDFFPTSLKDQMQTSHFYDSEILNTSLTLPGFAAGGWGGYPNTTIFDQSSTILGWTCGNLVATAEDNAVFFWHLLGDAGILSNETVTSMRNASLFSTGWAAGRRGYGTGLMTVRVGASGAPDWSRWGDYIGHGGDTYGFLSEQGLVWGLNATLTVVTNHDSPSITSLYCDLIVAAAEVLKGVTDTGMVCHRTESLADKSKVALV